MDPDRVHPDTSSCADYIFNGAEEAIAVSSTQLSGVLILDSNGPRDING